MRMSIDNSIRLLEDHHKWEKKYGLFGSGVDDAAMKLIEVAKKYQRIEQIIKEHDTDNMPEDYWYIDKIREVIEDGS